MTKSYVTAMFNEFSGGDGDLSINEFKLAMKKCFNMDVSDKVAMKIGEKADTNEDGKVTLTEVLKLFGVA